MKPRKLYKIGEVMKFANLSRQTIHNYTMLGLIHFADKTESGHRLYDEEVFDRLEKIERFKRHHTLQEVKAMLEEMDAQQHQDSQSLTPNDTNHP